MAPCRATAPVAVDGDMDEAGAVSVPHARRHGAHRAVLTALWRLTCLMHPGRSVKELLNRTRLLTAAAADWGTLRAWYAIPDNALLAAALQRAPMVSGALFWPYIHKDWPRARRLEVISRHYQLLEGGERLLTRAVHADVEMFALDGAHAGVRVVLDKAPWFVREGEVVANLFLHDVRLYSIAFTLGVEQGERIAYVGAIQGANHERALDIYRELTHAMHGLRPRDLMLAVFKLLCGGMGIRRIWAISEAARQHNSDYFRPEKKKALHTNLDDIWREHDGIDLGNGFFELAAEVHYRDLQEVPSKKRAAYRRRYQLLDDMAARVQCALRAP